MIYDKFGSEVEILEVLTTELIKIKFLDDDSSENVDPRTLKADGGLPEIITATAQTFEQIQTTV